LGFEVAKFYRSADSHQSIHQRWTQLPIQSVSSLTKNAARLATSSGRHPGAGARIRLFRNWQVLGGARVAQGAVPPRGLFASGKFDQYPEYRIAQIGLRLDRVGEIEEAKQPAFTPKRKSKNNAVTRFLGLWSTATGLVIGGMGHA